MPHHTSLIAILCVGFVLAFVFGLLAQRLRLSPLVGYLVAGIIAGPYTPGFVADQTLARQHAGDAELCRVGGQLEVRVGLHTGMVVIANHEVSPGNTLNIAMQIETAAMPGEIRVSESFRQLLRGFAEFESAGQVRIPSTPLVIPSFRLLIDTLKPIEEVAGSDSWHTRCIGRSRRGRAG